MMGLFEHWPYVNFHELNLDWIIKEIPKVFASRDEAQASADASAESAAASQLSADAALSSQEAAHQSELNAAQSEENAAGSAQDALDTVSNTLNQINLIQSRVDNIIPQGTQTEGNTELLDIRVAADGKIYNSAGDAVRGQHNELKSVTNENLAELSAYHGIKFLPITQGSFYRWDTGDVEPNQNYSRTTDIISVTGGDVIKFHNHVSDILAIVFYSDGAYHSRNLNAQDRYDIPADANGFGVTFRNPITGTITYENLTTVLKTVVNSLSINTVTSWVRWDNGLRESSNTLISTPRFFVKESHTYSIVTAATVRAFCFFTGDTFTSGTEARNATQITIPPGIDTLVIDFEYDATLPLMYLVDVTASQSTFTNNKTLGCLGDSLTQGVGNNDHSWVDKMQEFCGFSSVTNYGVTGETVEQITARVTNMIPDLDYVTILAGTNNAMWSTSQTIEEFKAAFDALLNAVVSRYPSSKVLGITPLKYDYSSGDVTRNWNVATANGLKLIDFVNAELEIYEKYSIPVLNLFAHSGIYPDISAQKTAFLADGVHPNQAGYFDILAPKIASMLKSM